MTDFIEKNGPSSEQMLARDLNVLWHPCSQMKDHENLPLTAIKSAKGAWLEDFDGNRYLDAISSWWVNIFGHTNPRINQAVKNQIDQLEHVILAGFSHEPAIHLAEKLVEITPDGLSKCFYADNGSSAVEVALKMSFHYWRNLGQRQKTRFISLNNGYHGETLGTLALGDVALYKETYAPLLMECLTVKSPDCYHRAEGQSWQDYSRQMIEPMRQTLEQHHHEVCAVFFEPLVQCAGNMRMYHPIYLTLLRELCDEYNVHLIADEIAVGFGRTGTLFACEQGNITPDFMCLSKGLTGGYLPLSAVLTTQQVYDAFYDDYENLTAFLHSHSYTGNPLACAAALETISIFETDNIIEKNKPKSQLIANLSQELVDHPHVAEVRQTGMITAIELCKNKTTKKAYPWQERRGLRVYQHGLKNEVLLRPLGDVVYFMPPYVISEDEIELMVNVAKQGIHLATQ